MSPNTNAPLWHPAALEQVCCALEEFGYITLPDWMPNQVTEQWLRRVQSLAEANLLQAAAIGRHEQQQVRSTIRGDRTFWLSDAHTADQQYLALMETLRQTLNRALYLGLSSFEAHYAHYAPGRHYQMHLDAFKGQSTRRISTVLHLNEAWTESDGGELRLYAADRTTQLLEVQPHAGTLTIFLSETFPHEVCPSLRDRFSIAGWFRCTDHRFRG